MKVTKEIWKDIKGYEGKYQVSNKGRIKSKRGILKGHKCTKGYLQISLWPLKRPYNRYIHRIVAESFIENPLNLPQVNHKNENKLDNTVENLEWCDCKYNCNYGTKIARQLDTAKKNGTLGKRLKNCKKVICVQTGEVFESYAAAARHFKFDKSNVSAICRGVRESCKGYSFKEV